jgi:hypothetical protein
MLLHHKYKNSERVRGVLNIANTGMFAVLHTVKPSSNEDLLNVDSIERVEINANYYLPSAENSIMRGMRKKL